MAEVIDAAVAEFVDKGYEGASMESIAARAGLTKGGLYHHFKGKEEILLAANERFMAPVYRMAEEAQRQPSPARGLRGFLRAYLRHWADRPRDMAFIALTLTKALQNPSWWPAMAAYRREMTAFYRRMLERAAAAGEIAPGDAGAQATAMLGAVDGLAAYVLMDEALAADVAADHLARAFLPAPAGTRRLRRRGA